MLVIDRWFLIFIITICVIFMLLLVSIIMRPFTIQREREAKCDHQFKTYKNDHPFRTTLHTFFCPKCGAVRHGGKVIPGLKIPVEKNVTVLPEKEKEKSGPVVRAKSKSKANGRARAS